MTIASSLRFLYVLGGSGLLCAGARTTPRAQLLFVFSRGFLADKRKDNIGYPIGKSVFSLKPIWQKLQIGN